MPEQLRAGGASKPYVLSEFGPLGPWEVPTTEWGAPFEQTSHEKAGFYRRAFEEGVASAPDLALGAYAFLWGHKMEGTATWFGMLLDDGARTEAVDVMTEIWTGQLPEDRAPVAEPLTIEGSGQVEPGTDVRVRTSVVDPEGGTVSVRWALRPESGEYSTGGDFRPSLPDIDGAIIEGSTSSALVRMPDEPGQYRIFLYAYDAAGNAATANVPLLVRG